MRGVVGLVVGTLLLVAAPARSEDLEAIVDIGPKARIDFVVERSREEIVDGRSTKAAMTFNYRHDITETRDGYRVVQTLTKAETGTAVPSGVPAALRKVTYETDPSLLPLRIVDFPAVLDQLSAAWISGAGDADPLNKVAVDQVRAVFERMGPEASASSLLQDQAYASIPQNALLNLNEPVTGEALTENPFGGEPLKTKASISLEGLDRGAGLAKVLYRETLDPISLKAMLNELAKRLGQASSIEAFSIDRLVECHFEVQLKTGLARRSDCVVTFESKDPGVARKRIDRTVITQTLATD